MKVLRRRDTDAIVDGRGAATTRYDAVAHFIDDLRADTVALPSPPPRPPLAATLDGRRPLRPASHPLPTRARPTVCVRLRALRPATIAIASGAVFFGGLATAGALPGPLQDASADLTSHVGVHLPSGEPVRAPSGNVAPAPAPASTPRAQPVETTRPRDASTTTQPAPIAAPPTKPIVGPHPAFPTMPPLTLPVAGPVPVPPPTPPIIALPSLPLHHLPRDLPHGPERSGSRSR